MKAARELLPNKPDHPLTVAPPKRTVIVHAREAFWSKGSIGKLTATHLHANLVVTSVALIGVRLIFVRFRRRARWLPSWVPLTRAIRPDFSLVHVKDPQSERYGGFIIPPHHVTAAAVDAFVTPPLVTEGQKFHADIAVVDQFGNDHWSSTITFTCRG